MSEKEWFQDYFDSSYSELILDSIKEEFTNEQVSMLETLLELKPSDKVLDLFCGKGRHAIPLARKGFQVTAVDLVPEYIETIQNISEMEKLNINTIVRDARTINFEKEFNKAYLMFTSFGYFSDAENLELLHTIHKSLKKSGLLLIDIENRDYIVKHFIHEKWREKDFGFLLERHKFFPLPSRQHTKRILVMKDGTTKESFRDLRLYSAHEIITLAKSANLELVKIVGDYDSRPFQINSPRIIAVFKAS